MFMFWNHFFTSNNFKDELFWGKYNEFGNWKKPALNLGYLVDVL